MLVAAAAAPRLETMKHGVPMWQTLSCRVNEASSCALSQRGAMCYIAQVACLLEGSRVELLLQQTLGTANWAHYLLPALESLSETNIIS